VVVLGPHIAETDYPKLEWLHWLVLSGGSFWGTGLMCRMNSSSREQLWVANFWLSDVFCIPVHVADTECPAR